MREEENQAPEETSKDGRDPISDKYLSLYIRLTSSRKVNSHIYYYCFHVINGSNLELH